MICKACGAPLSAHDTKCPQCGSEVPPTEGGVGFWDMLEKPEDLESGMGSVTAAGAEGLPAGIGQALPKGLSPKLKGIVGGLGAACAGGLLAASLMTLNTVQTIRTELQTDTLALQEQAGRLEADLQELDGRVNRLDEVADQWTGTLAIASEPVDVTGIAGTTGADDEALLVMRVTGKVASFSWERRVDGVWEPIAFDEKTGVNETLGLRLVEDVDEGVSRLVASDLAGAAAGEYRCVATDEQGNTLGRTAFLAVVQDEAAASKDVDATPADDLASADAQD